MKDITCNDEELKNVLQELMGYLLSPEIRCEKAFYFLVGVQMEKVFWHVS